MNERILQIRSLIGDPIATSINYENPLPASALEGAAYTTGDGVYQVYRAGAWKPVKILMDDSEIERVDFGGSVYSAALNAITVLLLKINQFNYITSGGAGAQSVGFPSLKEMSDFFDTKKAYIASIAAMAGDVQRAGRRPVPVGGCFDWENPC